MYANSLPSRNLTSGSLPESMALALARRLKRGRLTLCLPDGRSHVFPGREPGPQAEMRIRNPRVFRRLLSGGELGLAESYIDGDWDSPDLPTLIALGAENEEVFGATLAGGMVTRLLGRAVHSLRPNSKRGARRNIAAHYDLGNEFYAAWLDPTMTYSAALFQGVGESLAEAQANKYRRMAELAGITRSDHVLEIGCGWGGFCTWAAREFGCRVTAITISREQFDHTSARVRAERLDERVEVRLQDYRDLEGEFDAVVSIEMLEAVGESFWPVYFQGLKARLRPGGRAALQVITIADDRFEGYRQKVDFIQRYIFPGGMLPSPRRLAEVTADAGLSTVAASHRGSDYAKTLNIWQERFERAWPEITKARDGRFDARFRRLWRFYLAYCEAGFREGRIDLLHLALQRPASSG